MEAPPPGRPGPFWSRHTPLRVLAGMLLAWAVALGRHGEDGALLLWIVVGGLVVAAVAFVAPRLRPGLAATRPAVLLIVFAAVGLLRVSLRFGPAGTAQLLLIGLGVGVLLELLLFCQRLLLPTRILLGLLCGAMVGIALNVALAPARGALPDAAYQEVLWIADNVGKPAGDVFLRLLFMVVVPLVFCSLVLGVAGLGDLRKLGSIGGRTLLWFVGTTALAVGIGLVLVNLIQPGRTMSAETAQQVMEQFAGSARETIAQGQAGTGFSIQTFVNMIPRNLVASAGNEKEALGVICFALLVGMAVSQMAAERTRAFREVLETLYEVCVKIIGLALKIAPLGVFGLILAVTAKLGLEVLGSLLVYVGMTMAGLVGYQFVVLPLLAFLFTGVRPGRLLSGCRTLMVTAFSTSSSNATLPTTMRTAVEVFGVPKQVAGFVLPLGATMNMNGTALFEGVTVLFLAQVAGIELSIGQQALVVVLAVLTAIGAAGVPGGSLPLLAIVLSQVGVPPESIALILGTDRIVDMTRTMPNVTSDLICSLWIARGEGSTLQPPAAHGDSPTSST